MAWKGIYNPKNPHKYCGNVNSIVFRSGLEFSYMRKLDDDKRVKCWSSEEVVIPYANPVTGRVHRYFPDFFVEMTNGKKFIIEIKPLAQTKQPTKNTKKQDRRTERRFINESLTYAKNMGKWGAAERWCAKNGCEFKIITEKEIGKVDRPSGPRQQQQRRRRRN